jgi:hypothetical protein
MNLRALGTAFLVLASASARAGVARVWAVNDGEKIERDDLASPFQERNSVWDGRRVHLFGARNEIVAFQVIVESDARGIAALRLALPELRQKDGPARIRYAPPAADPTDTVGRPIQILPVHYLNVTQTTRAEWAWEPNSPAAPADTLGWKPVQLVPENARPGRGGFPLAMAPANSQAIWVDVYVGREVPAGAYEGTITVTADARTIRLPVELQVYDFALPDRNSVTAMVYYEPSQPEL